MPNQPVRGMSPKLLRFDVMRSAICPRWLGLRFKRMMERMAFFSSVTIWKT